MRHIKAGFFKFNSASQYKIQYFGWKEALQKYHKPRCFTESFGVSQSVKSNSDLLHNPLNKAF